MRFYELSFSTIENVLEDIGYDSTLGLMMCSLYNNMGHIYARVNDVEESQFCLEFLQRTVKAEEFNDDNMICEEDCGFFSQYLMFCASTTEHFRTARAA